MRPDTWCHMPEASPSVWDYLKVLRILTTDEPAKPEGAPSTIRPETEAERERRLYPQSFYPDGSRIEDDPISRRGFERLGSPAECRDAVQREPAGDVALTYPFVFIGESAELGAAWAGVVAR